MSSTTDDVLGSVATLWRYPVKSMLGEELSASDVTEQGLAGDRAYAALPDRLYLIDAEGRIAYKSGQGPMGFKPEELEAAITTLRERSRKPN